MTATAPALAGRNPVFRTSSAFPPSAAVAVAAATFFTAQSLALDAASTVAWIAVVVVLLAAIPRRVEVGAEGLRIAWLGSARLVRYDQVRRAEPLGTTSVLLTFKSGETLRLARGVFDAATPRDVLERLWQTLAAGAEGGVRANERAALARGRRDVETWLGDLRQLATPGAQYRQGMVTHDRLLSIATNPAVEVELRGAAAVAYAFGGPLDDATRDELRAVASLTVDTTLREVFVRVADARDEQDLSAALRELA